MPETVFLTGATGFVGMAMLARLVERNRRVVCLVRAGSQAEADARLDSVMVSLLDAPGRHMGRVHAVAGDLTAPGLGMEPKTRDAIAEEVGEIVHGAASVAFDLPLAESRAINVEGTRQVLELAEDCARRGKGLRRLTYVSTAYVAGDRKGVAAEHELDAGQGFRNTYEHSKHEAEALVRAHRQRLPITVVRPSIIVGERGTGWTASFNVIYGPLRTFASGGYPVLPGRRGGVIDVVTVDHVADATLALTASPDAAGGTYHLVAGEQSSTVGELVDLAATRFEQPAPRLIPPRIYRKLVHPLMLRRSSPKVQRALRRSEIFFPYFSLPLRFDNARARELLEPAGVRATPIAEHFDAMVDFAEEARWGRNPIGRARAQSLARGREHDPRQRRGNQALKRKRERVRAGDRA